MMATDFGAMRRINSSSCGLIINASPNVGCCALYLRGQKAIHRLHRFCVIGVICGCFMSAQTLLPTQTREIISYDPSTNEEIERVPLMNAGDVAAAVSRARAAQQAWADRSYGERARFILRAREIVLEQLEETA